MQQSRQSSGACKHCRCWTPNNHAFPSPSLHCVQLSSPRTAGVMDRDCQSGVLPGWHHALRNPSPLISWFCPRKKSDDWSYFSPEECCSSSLHLPWHFPALHLWLITRLKPKWKTRRGISSSCSPGHLTRLGHAETRTLTVGLGGHPDSLRMEPPKAKAEP